MSNEATTARPVSGLQHDLDKPIAMIHREAILMELRDAIEAGTFKHAAESIHAEMVEAVSIVEDKPTSDIKPVEKIASHLMTVNLSCAYTTEIRDEAGKLQRRLHAHTFMVRFADSHGW